MISLRSSTFPSWHDSRLGLFLEILNAVLALPLGSSPTWQSDQSIFLIERILLDKIFIDVSTTSLQQESHFVTVLTLANTQSTELGNKASLRVLLQAASQTRTTSRGNLSLYFSITSQKIISLGIKPIIFCMKRE